MFSQDAFHVLENAVNRQAAPLELVAAALLGLFGITICSHVLLRSGSLKQVFHRTMRGMAALAWLLPVAAVFALCGVSFFAISPQQTPVFPTAIAQQQTPQSRATVQHFINNSHRIVSSIATPMRRPGMVRHSPPPRARFPLPPPPAPYSAAIPIRWTSAMSDGPPFDNVRNVAQVRNAQSATVGGDAKNSDSTDDVCCLDVSITPAVQIAEGGPGRGLEVTPAGSTSPATKKLQPSDTNARLPDWVTPKTVDLPNRQLIVVDGGIAGSAQVAAAAARTEAIAAIRDDFARAFPGAKHWQPPEGLLMREAERRSFIEPITRHTLSSGTPFQVFRAYYQVELSPAVRTRLYPHWKSEVVDQRLWRLGGLAGLLTLTFATAATYFRLDDRTAGHYRRRLKLAAVSVIAAAGMAAAAVL